MASRKSTTNLNQEGIKLDLVRASTVIYEQKRLVKEMEKAKEEKKHKPPNFKTIATGIIIANKKTDGSTLCCIQ